VGWDGSRWWPVAGEQSLAVSASAPSIVSEPPVPVETPREEKITELAKESKPADDTPAQPLLSDFGLYKCVHVGRWSWV